MIGIFYSDQVGKAIRMFVVRKEKTLPDGKMGVGDAKVYINPVLSEPGEEHDTLLEGCLSFPGIQVEVERPLAITVEALDLEGNKFKEVITGYDARVIMHENDHLNGTFFIDRCSKEEKQRVEEEYLIRAGWSERTFHNHRKKPIEQNRNFSPISEYPVNRS